jgi:uncharacterized protein YkwD
MLQALFREENVMVRLVGGKRLALFLLLSGLFVAVGCGRKDSSGGGGGSGTDAAAIQLAQLINEERQLRGNGPLTWDATIAAVETAHAQWLADQDPPGPYLLPYREDGQDGKVFTERLDDASITYSVAQEWGNSSYDGTNAGIIFNRLPDWVFETQWDRIGIGYVRPPKRESGQHYWVVGLVED